MKQGQRQQDSHSIVVEKGTGKCDFTKNPVVSVEHSMFYERDLLLQVLDSFSILLE